MSRAYRSVSALREGAHAREGSGQGIESGLFHAEVGPSPPLLAANEPSLDELFEVVRNSALRESDGFGEVAHAGLAVAVSSDHRHEPNPGRVGQGPESARQTFGLLMVDHATGDGVAASAQVGGANRRRCGRHPITMHD